MADRFYGADLGVKMPAEVVEAATTTSKAIEVRVTYTTTGLTKNDVLNAIEAIKMAVIADTWAPA